MVGLEVVAEVVVAEVVVGSGEEDVAAVGSAADSVEDLEVEGLAVEGSVGGSVEGALGDCEC